MSAYWPKITFWRIVAALVMAVGFYATVVRFTMDLGASSALSDDMAWGLWTGFKLIGVGLAAGGFTITAAVHLLNLEDLKPIVRSAILTAFLGYLLFISLLIFDLGLPYRIWHPMIMWNPHSVMFEVAWCVMLYTTVLALEFSPMVLERLNLRTPLKIIHGITVPVVVAGVLLSTLHQSSLGTLFVIVPEKLYGLWYSPLLPVFFFLSAIAAGLSMVIIESYLSARAFGKRVEMRILQEVGRVVVVVLALYIVIKFQDMSGRHAFSLLLRSGPERFLFLIEWGFGALIPMVLLAFPAVRRDRTGLFCSALLVILGFVLNRLNVSVTGMQAGTGAEYFPSFLEMGIVALLIAVAFLGFRVAVKYLNVFPTVGANGNGHWNHRQRNRTPIAHLTRGLLVALAAIMILGTQVFEFSPAARTPGPETAAGFAPLPELRLPEDHIFARGEDSPGTVTFSHAAHVNARTPDCAVCHAGAVPILGGRSATVPPGDTMHSSAQCGACHNGREAFNLEDNCEACHAVE